MPLDKLDPQLRQEIEDLTQEGRAKAPERVIEGYVPPKGDRGPRYRLAGSDREYLRMNSNSYLSLSHRPELIEAADAAGHEFGVGPGAVRFIDGTFRQHRALEERIARFTGRPAAKIFNSAYTSNLGLCITLTNKTTYWIGDQLNHNCIIRGMRIANVPRENKAIFAHNDMDELEKHLENVPDGITRVVVIFDGIFSMRGDVIPLDRVTELAAAHHDRFPDGVITVCDDSHGIGAFGTTGRGAEEHCGAKADVLVGTFGKAFGVNGGFIAGSEALIEAVRQMADTYIYTNPLSTADCAAAVAAIDLTDSEEGRARLEHLHARVAQFRKGIGELGIESIDGPHPVVPLLIRDTDTTRRYVRELYERGVLVVGLTFPVVPKGDETIRVQINAAHTEADIDELLGHLAEIQKGG